MKLSIAAEGVSNQFFSREAKANPEEGQVETEAVMADPTDTAELGSTHSFGRDLFYGMTTAGAMLADNVTPYGTVGTSHAVGGVIGGVQILAGIKELNHAQDNHDKVNAAIHLAVGAANIAAPWMGSAGSTIRLVGLGVLGVKALVDNSREIKNIMVDESWGTVKDAATFWQKPPSAAEVAENPEPPANQ